MKKFPLTPPTKTEDNAVTFKGGMMPVPTKGVSMIILDVRSLQLSMEEGKELEEQIRTLVLEKLSYRVKNLQDMSMADLSSSVLGISFD